MYLFFFFFFPSITILFVLTACGGGGGGGSDGNTADVVSNQRCSNGSGGARNTDNYTQVAPSPGADNDCAVPPTTNVIINEVDVDQASNDAAEFIELYDGGIGKTSLDGLSLVFYNGSDSLSYFPLI